MVVWLKNGVDADYALRTGTAMVGASDAFCSPLALETIEVHATAATGTDRSRRRTPAGLDVQSARSVTVRERVRRKIV